MRLETRRKFLTDTLAYAFAQVLIRLRGLIILPLFARIEGAEAYGIYTQISVTVALLVPFISLRLTTAAIRFLSSEDDRVRFRNRFYAAFSAMVLVAALVSTLLVAFGTFASKAILGDLNYVPFMWPTGVLLLTSVVSDYALNYFRITNRMPVMSGVLLGQTALETALMLLAVQLGYGAGGALWALTGVRGTVGLGLMVTIGRRIGWFGFEWQGLKEMLKYSLPLMPNGIMRWTTNYGDRIVITHFLGLAAVGAYSASYSIASSLNLLIMPLGFVFFPLVSQMWDRQEVEEVRRYFVYVMRYYLFLAVPVCVGLALVSQHLLAFLATSEFVAGAGLVFWIALGVVLDGLFQINVYAFHITFATKYVTPILALGSALNLGLNFLLVPRIGLIGSALATAATFFLTATIAIASGKPLVGYRLEWLDISKSILAAIPMAVCVYLIPASSLAGIAAIVLLGLLVYFGLLVGLRAVSRAELLQLRQLVVSSLPFRTSQ